VSKQARGGTTPGGGQIWAEESYIDGLLSKYGDRANKKKSETSRREQKEETKDKVLQEKSDGRMIWRAQPEVGKKLAGGGGGGTKKGLAALFPAPRFQPEKHLKAV